jgi:hypothetical protein
MICLRCSCRTRLSWALMSAWGFLKMSRRNTPTALSRNHAIADVPKREVPTTSSLNYPFGLESRRTCCQEFLHTILDQEMAARCIDGFSNWTNMFREFLMFIYLEKIASNNRTPATFWATWRLHLIKYNRRRTMSRNGS